MDNEDYATLWNFISSDKILTYAEKILYSIILSYSNQSGFSWATNLQLMEKMGIGPGSQRTLQDFLAGLKEKGWIKIEGGTRDRKIFPLKKRIIAENQPQSNSVKKSIIAENPRSIIAGNQPQSPTPPYKEKNNMINNIKHRGEVAEPMGDKIRWSPPLPSSSKSPKKQNTKQPQLMPGGWYQLPQSMLNGSPPTPGPENMVNDVRKFLSEQFHIGSRRYKMAQEDVVWFLGYSPSVIDRAMGKVHAVSKSGKDVHDIVSAIFSACGEIRLGDDKGSSPGFSMYYR